MGAIPCITRHTFTGVATNRIHTSYIYRTVISIGHTFIHIYMKHYKTFNYKCAYTTTPASPTQGKTRNMNRTTEQYTSYRRNNKNNKPSTT
jgi:hypothetical protein